MHAPAGLATYREVQANAAIAERLFSEVAALRSGECVGR